LRLPSDYVAIANLLITYWSEPISAERLQEDDAKLYETGHTWRDDNGLLAGYDRDRRVAVNAYDEIVGYLWTWRAPWTEPGYLNNTLVVAEAHRNYGVGEQLLRHITQWGGRLGATMLATEIWDDHPEALRFAERKGFEVERHSYQSVLKLDGDQRQVEHYSFEEVLGVLEMNGIRFLTLADEPGEDSERKLYELYKETLVDIPGYLGDVPDITEWRKWYLQAEGYSPELVLIAAEGDRFVGVSNVLYKATTNGMYHEYTGVSRRTVVAKLRSPSRLRRSKRRSGAARRTSGRTTIR
jgi:GNAT superfamily N-acetyltransferase